MALLKAKVTRAAQLVEEPPYFPVSPSRLKLLAASAPSLQTERVPYFTSRETEAQWRRVIPMKSHEMGGTTTGKAQDWELRHPAFMPRLSSLVSSKDREIKVFTYGH